MSGSVCELDEHTDAICDHLNEHPPHTIAEARQAIEELTDVRRSETQVRLFLRRVGFSRRKTGSLPAKADPEAQAVFKKKSLSLA
jgi:transposase